MVLVDEFNIRPCHLFLLTKGAVQPKLFFQKVGQVGLSVPLALSLDSMVMNGV